MRLDVYICKSYGQLSRTDAKNLITSGFVTVNGKPVTKPAFDTLDTDKVEVDTSQKKYVSRGGFKLEYALDSFGINIQGKRAVDVGASSGGFTDCLLQRGASCVIAIDSGRDQLVSALRNDSRVICMEECNAKFITREQLPYIPDIAVMDVSFISAKLIIPAVYSILSDEADFICLIKPQFEVGRSGLGKGGIVKDEKLRKKAVGEVVDFAVASGFTLSGLVESPIKGGDGNIEFLACFRKEKI